MTVLKDYIAALVSSFTEARVSSDIMPAKDVGIIRIDDIVDFNQYIESLLQQFLQHEQLRPNINNAIALVGRFDVMRIIAEEIE